MCVCVISRFLTFPLISSSELLIDSEVIIQILSLETLTFLHSQFQCFFPFVAARVCLPLWLIPFLKREENETEDKLGPLNVECKINFQKKTLKILFCNIL